MRSMSAALKRSAELRGEAASGLIRHREAGNDPALFAFSA